MNKHSKIEFFKSKIKNWKENFQIKQFADFKNNESEMSNIIQMELVGDFEGLVDFWKNKQKEHYFELKHPLIKGVRSRAVKSLFAYNLNNFVFMVDEKEEHPWIFIQDSELVGVVICDDYIFVSPYKMTKHLNVCMDYLADLQEWQDYNYKDIAWEFGLKCNRPGHFFFTYMPALLAIKSSKAVENTPMFFVPDEIKLSNANNKVILHSKTIGIMTVLNMDKKFPSWQELVQNVNLKVYKESINEYEHLVDKDDIQYDITLWLGLAAEKRAWIEQVEGCLNIINEFSRKFKKIKIYLDGMTAYDRQIQVFAENDKLFEKLKTGIDKLNEEKQNEGFLCHITSLIGRDYRTKICCCFGVDMAISEGNTTGLVPFSFCKKPGVVFDIVGMDRFYRQFNIKNLLFVEKSQISFDDTELQKQDIALRSYHMDYRYIYNLCVKVIKEIKNIKLDEIKI